jgi:hypothetical protein
MSADESTSSRHCHEFVVRLRHTFSTLFCYVIAQKLDA